MPKKIKNKTKANRFSLMNSYSEVLNNKLNSGETIFYARNCMLPIINIKILVKERSREELSDTDIMLFKLIQQGISSIESIVLLTGLAEKLVLKHLNEMDGRSFISYKHDKFELTSLGLESLQHGVPVRKVLRSFRYCAVSSRLLPRSAYELVYSEMNELRDKNTRNFLKYSHILQEEQMVSLSGMDLAQIESKRALNITDEAISFDEINGYTSGYLQTKLFLVGKNKPERAIVAFGKSCLEYNAEDIIPVIQKIDTVRTIDVIKNQLDKDGIVYSDIQLDEYGLPKISIESASNTWFQKKIESGQQAILMCGTNHHKAKPVSSWILKGYTLRYELTEDHLIQEANLLRDFIESSERYYKVPYKEREDKSIRRYVSKKYPPEQLLVLKHLVDKYNIRRLASWLPDDLEDAAV
ncbi:hypothetical protein NX722_15290 [Endozoicomonas gorgoniicola]|uniref:Uncharacterized protein n=1 Tax=Endozoicomonas gorgoniicola TaxID=1234144 RepID=A0ABT3MX42_9GAMM|nr:hypothetical protein [Endozoicomonas gorgoniicola]MCW7553961.1 hypothetical protein [Endozoicomonas gorgoniicola]